MNRRYFLGTSTMLLAGCATGTARVQRPSVELDSDAPAIVLVHGAWHGGWCWALVEPELRTAGYKVFAPTLTGLGERAHLRSPVPSLATHVEDIVRLIEWNELHNIVLVGHSYGGMIVSAVADRMRNRIHHAIYLDAAVPSDGETMISQDPSATQESIVQSTKDLQALTPDGNWIDPLPADVFGIPRDRPDLMAWVNRRLTPHPLASWLEPVALPNGGSEGLARTYIHCTEPVLPRSSMPVHAALIRDGGRANGWRYRELATGHDAMISAPSSVVREVLAVCG